MREMSLRRRKVVVLAASMAAMSGVGPILLKGHRYLVMAWVGLMVVLAVAVIGQMVKLKREEG